MTLYLLTNEPPPPLGLVESAVPITPAHVQEALRVQHEIRVQQQDTVGPVPESVPYDIEAHQAWNARWREVRDAMPLPEVAALVAEQVGGRVRAFEEVRG